MPDRLAELRRQRALIQEHLSWLDKQIAEAGDKTPPLPAAPGASPTASTAPVPAPDATAAGVVAAALKASASAGTASSVTPLVPTDAPEVAAAAEAILEEYRSDPVSLKTDVRKGCFLYFFGALALVALGVAVLWFAFRK